jgi:hypothetical protein
MSVLPLEAEARRIGRAKSSTHPTGLVAPIQGEAGVIGPPVGYFTKLREPCTVNERTSTVVSKNIPESLMLRMLSPAISHERQEDIGPLG